MTSPLLSDAGRAERRVSVADDGEFAEHRIRHGTVPRDSHHTVASAILGIRRRNCSNSHHEINKRVMVLRQLCKRGEQQLPGSPCSIRVRIDRLGRYILHQSLRRWMGRLLASKEGVQSVGISWERPKSSSLLILKPLLEAFVYHFFWTTYVVAESVDAIQGDATCKVKRVRPRSC
jgi:hypothetical protein